MSTQTDKIREALECEYQHLVDEATMWIHENRPHLKSFGEELAHDLAAFSKDMILKAPEPRLTVDQLREEMELLGSMIRAERSTATEANRQCTDEQLERCYQLGDRLTKAAQ